MNVKAVLRSFVLVVTMLLLGSSENQTVWASVAYLISSEGDVAYPSGRSLENRFGFGDITPLNPSDVIVVRRGLAVILYERTDPDCTEKGDLRGIVILGSGREHRIQQMLPVSNCELSSEQAIEVAFDQALKGSGKYVIVGREAAHSLGPGSRGMSTIIDNSSAFYDILNKTKARIPAARIRARMLTVSENDAQRVFGLDANRRPREYIQNDFEVQGEIVVDHATGLMWQKVGSRHPMTYQDAQAYIDELNRERFGGYTDWGLPTIPELLSLMTKEKQPKWLYINRIFGSEYEFWYWSADKRSPESAWGVSFNLGVVDWRNLIVRLFVRAVRS